MPSSGSMIRSDKKPTGYDPIQGMVPATPPPAPVAPIGQYGSNPGMPQPRPMASMAPLLEDTAREDFLTAQGNAREDQLRGQSQIREDQLRTEDQSRKDDMFRRIQGMMGGGSAATVQHDPQGDAEAARGAAFARAKEQAGQTARASMTALNNVVDERGLMGSSIAAAGAGQVVGQAGNDVNSFTRDQLESDLGRSDEVADLEYQGGIQQRGQDLNKKQALMGLLAGGNLY